MLFHLSSLSSIRVLPLKKRRYRTFFELTVACCCIAYWQFGSKGTKVSIAAFRTLRRPRYCIAQQQRYFEFSGNYQQSRLLSQSTMKSVPEEIEKTLKNIVIIGGGIQGAAVAYYLSKLSKGDRNVELNITVLEAVSIASAASGKGGGFMAKTWGAGTPTQALHEIAFDLYAEDLTPTLNCTSYRKLPVLSVTPQSARGSRSLRSPSSSVRSIWPNWLDPDRIVNAQVMGTGIDTAQITPLEVTEKMIQATQASIVYGRCTGIELEDHVGSGDVSRSVIGVRYIPKQEDKTVGSSERPEVLPAHQIVVCAGPWSCSLVDWIAEEQGDRKASDQSLQLKLPMEGIKSTSIVFPPPDPSSSSECDNGVDATALFCGEDDRYNTHRMYSQSPYCPVYIHAFISHLSFTTQTSPFFFLQWKCIRVQMVQSIFAVLVVRTTYLPVNCVKILSCTTVRQTKNVFKPQCRRSRAWCRTTLWPCLCEPRMSWIACKLV